MLVEFGFSNYRSFRDRAILSMEATGISNFRNSVMEINNLHLLRGAAIFGKNGGGKSNVIRAFWLAVQFIRNAQKTQHEKAEIPVIPFLLNDYSEKQPTEFSFVYILGGVKYWYSFSATRKKIISETLYHAPKGQKAIVFIRKNQIFTFTDSKSKRKLISETVAENQLFFSVACTMNDKVCINAMRWFREYIYFSRDYTDIPVQLLEYAEASCRASNGSDGKKVFLPRLEKRFAELKQNLSAKRQALEAEGKAGPVGSAKIALASMDSEVHDIDRDILAELLSCYGFPVTDLGCGCPCEKILETVICEQPDMVYLSAQFATGLSEMVRIAREFKRREIGTVLVIGGGAASDTFTAVRIAPEALGPVVYVSDVRKVVKVIGALADDTKRPAFLAALKSHQDKLRRS